MSEIQSPLRPNSRTYFNNKEHIKKDQQERKRCILYLILKYLNDQNYWSTIEALQNETQIPIQQYQICDNIDLEIILQEFQSYYFIKYQKYPTILKKLTNDNTPSIKNCVSASSSNNKLIKTKQKNENAVKDIEKPPQEDFPINITPLKKLDKLEIYENDIDKSLVNWEDYSNENREIIKEILNQILPKTNDTTNKWEDCIGHEQIIETLKEGLIYPIMYPELFKNIESWNSVLLFGPPGTGKTLLAKTIAYQIRNRTFFNITSSMIISKWRGESEKIVKILFDLAINLKPSIIFIDEIDGLCSINQHHEASRRFKSELLIQIDGILSRCKQEIFILATTNTPWDIDPALLRRFDQRLFVPLPNIKEKKQLFQHYLKDLLIDTNHQIFDNLDEYLSGSDIRIICKEINMMLIREQIRTNKTRKLTIDDLKLAINKIKSCIVECDYQKYFVWNRKFGTNLP